MRSRDQSPAHQLPKCCSLIAVHQFDAQKYKMPCRYMQCSTTIACIGAMHYINRLHGTMCEALRGTSPFRSQGKGGDSSWSVHRPSQEEVYGYQQQQQQQQQEFYRYQQQQQQQEAQVVRSRPLSVSCFTVH